MPIPVMVIVCVHRMVRCVYTVTAAVYSTLTVSSLSGFIWALAREKLSLGVCKQQRRRPDCTVVQSGQRLCYLLIEKYYIKTCYKLNFTILASLCS